MKELEAIYKAVLEGDASAAGTGVEIALQANIPAGEIMQKGLVGAMNEVGRLYENCEYYVPEMMIAARAMQTGLTLLKPHLVESGVRAAGRVVMGTVKGDIHDIGKNLVGIMLEGAGFEVTDLGTDVAPERFVKEVKGGNVDVISLSALLTTTMPAMGETIQALQNAGVRDRVKVMVGGAPVTEAYAMKIGADGYGPDASAAVRLARKMLAK
jgi:5-methyltetrahydrofolate--homocysteine methyltransferase